MTINDNMRSFGIALIGCILVLTVSFLAMDWRFLRTSRKEISNHLHETITSQARLKPCLSQDSSGQLALHNSSLKGSQLILQFFISPPDERDCLFPGSTSPGFPQPITVFGRMVTEGIVARASKTNSVLCFHSTHDIGECGRAIRYTRIRQGRKFSCGDVYDVPERPGCRAGFDGYTPLLYLEGPTFVFSRTAHFPHFLEEVASGANWLARNNLSYFSHALIDETGGTCQTHGAYRSGSWAPAGSPLNATLQIAMIRTIAKGVVFSWGIRKNRSVCVGEPYRKWRMQTPDLCSENGCQVEYFDNPAICAEYRKRMMQLFGIPERKFRRQNLLIVQRFSGGRVITNLDSLLKLDSFRQLNLNVSYTSLEGLDVEEQVRIFSTADILIAHHGAAIALSSLMRPGGLVIEIFNYNVKCDFFDYLYKGCGLKWERLLNTNGTKHLPYLGCNGNNRKDGSENAAVDLTAISNIIHEHVRGLNP